MRDDEILARFLGEWLNIRRQEPAAGEPARTLLASLSALIQGESPRRFLEALGRRVDHLRELQGVIDQEGNNPPTAPQSPRGNWLHNAQLILARWDQSSWSASAIGLSKEKNGLMNAAVGQSLDESVEPGQARRQLTDPLQRLRKLDAKPFRLIPLPPREQAPWEPSAYIYPRMGRQVADLLIADPMFHDPQVPSTNVPAEGLLECLRWIGEGWPVPIARLEGSIRKLTIELPEEASLRGPLERALLLLRPEDGYQAPQTTELTTNGEPGRDQPRGRLDELARSLLAESTDDAQAFGRRLKELSDLPGESTTTGLHQELVGCLASLDDAASPMPSNRWRIRALEQLARIAEGLEGGEVLGSRLIGQPLALWTEDVSVVGNDGEAPPGEPRRITRVERIGYRIVFSNGEHHPLIRARVWIAE